MVFIVTRVFRENETDQVYVGCSKNVGKRSDASTSISIARFCANVENIGWAIERGLILVEEIRLIMKVT